MFSKRETIKVCIRLRPLLAHEDVEYWKVDETTNTISSSPPDDIQIANKNFLDSIYSAQSFHFDKIYNKQSSSQTIYKEMCRDITKNLINGINGSIFTYGQTTSGKTYTMLGSPQSPGILPCVLKDIFDLINNIDGTFKIFCTYVEIYNENIHDLLTDANSLKLIDDPKYGVIVSGATKVLIQNFEEGISLKDKGEENRQYRDTIINEYSSRSHTVFQIFVEYANMDNDSDITTRYSVLNLVDLAGSEKLNESESQSGETGYINKSLFVLANVINKLAEGKKMHIPYRDSKLTRLLSMALGGNSFITIICCCSPSAISFFQTLSTLRFASRAKIVKLKPNINEYYDEKEMIEIYKDELKRLQEENDVIPEEESEERKEEKDYMLMYYNEVLNNKRLKLENEKLKKDFDEAMMKGSGTGNETNFLQPYLEMIVKDVSINEPNNLSFYLNNLNQINKEYLDQLKTLQQFYINKVNEFKSTVNNNTITGNSSFLTTSIVQKDKPFSPNDINDQIFKSITLFFNPQNTIQSIKAEYEKKVDGLESIMLEYKAKITNYYQKIIYDIRNSSTEPENEKSAAISYIQNEFSQCTNYLKGLYEKNQSELENNFFDTLKKITSFKNNKFN